MSLTRNSENTARQLLKATLLAPLVMLPGFLLPYVSVRAIYMHAVITVVFALLIFMLLTREYTISSTSDYVMLSLAALAFVSGLSAVFGLSPWRSVFGDFERMWGVLVWAHLVFYYILLRTFLKADDWRVFLRLSLLVCTVTCVYGLLQYYKDVIPLPIYGAAGNPVYSTVGNSGFYAGYLLFNLGFAIYMWFEDVQWKWRMVYPGAAALIILLLFLASNRSSLLGSILGLVVASTCYSTFKARRKWLAPTVSLIISAVLLVPVYIARTNPNSAVAERLPVILQRVAGISMQTADVVRLPLWRAAWNGFLERPLLGYGPENYRLVWNDQSDRTIYEWIDNTADRAHSAYLEAMSNEGIFGIITLLLVFGSILAALTNAYRKGSITIGGFCALLGLFVAYGFYLIFWFFDLSSTMLLIVIAAHLATLRAGGPWLRFGPARPVSLLSKIVLGAGGLLLIGVLYLQDFSSLRTARSLHLASLPTRSLQASLNDFEVVFRSPSPLAKNHFNLYNDFLSAITPTSKADTAELFESGFMDRALALGKNEIDKAVARDPFNYLLYMEKGYLYQTAGEYYNDPRMFNEALLAVTRAIMLDSDRIPAYLVLADIHMSMGNFQAAYESLAKAYNLLPNSGPTHYQFAKLEFKRGNIVMADRWLRSSFYLGYSGHPALTLELGELLGVKDKSAETSLYMEYLKSMYPSIATEWRITTPEPPSNEVKEMLRRMGRSIRPAS